MALLVANPSANRIWLARPNCSLSADESKTLLLAVAAVSGVISIAFTLIGAWPVIPFVGAELGVLWWALRRIEIHAGDFERITLEPGLLTVESRLGSHTERHEFQPYWTRLECLTLPQPSNHRLLICSQGTEIEVGSLLTEEQKMTLAKELKQELGAR
jgi:uncharacterized membrane protein